MNEPSLLETRIGRALQQPDPSRAHPPNRRPGSDDARVDLLDGCSFAAESGPNHVAVRKPLGPRSVVGAEQSKTDEVDVKESARVATHPLEANAVVVSGLHTREAPEYRVDVVEKCICVRVRGESSERDAELRSRVERGRVAIERDARVAPSRSLRERGDPREKPSSNDRHVHFRRVNRHECSVASHVQGMWRGYG